jgi:uncharacterized protein (DUF58 family)
MLIEILTAPYRAWRWLAKARPIRFTRFGTFYILFSLAVGAAAINTGNNLLYLMLGLLLGFIIISGLLSDSCLWGVQIELEPAGDFYAHQPAEWRMHLRKNRFPGIGLQIETFWSDGSHSRHLVYYLPSHGTETLALTLTPKRRGLLRLERVRFATRFPFGLFEKSHTGSMDQSWTIFPEITPLPLRRLLAADGGLSDQPAGRRGWGVTPFDLRDYQSGDSSKRIHWKSSAKRGRLIVAETEEEAALTRWVQVRAWPAESERFIAFVASLIYALARDGHPVGLIAPGLRFKPDSGRAHLKTLLSYLALVDPAQDVAAAGSEISPRGLLDANHLWEQSAP